MKNKAKKLITCMAVTLLFITAYKGISFAEEQAQGAIPEPTDIIEGVSWWDWPQEEMSRVLPWYDRQVDLDDINQHQLITQHGRQYYTKVYGDPSTTTYFFNDMKVAENKWLYSPAWVPDGDQTPCIGYFNHYSTLYQASDYYSSKTPYREYNAYRSDENAVYVLGLLCTYHEDAPETVVVPKTIGGKSVIGVWLTGNINALEYYSGGPKTIYLPKDCGIISGQEYWRGDRPKIIRY